MRKKTLLAGALLILISNACLVGVMRSSGCNGRAPVIAASQTVDHDSAQGSLPARGSPTHMFSRAKQLSLDQNVTFEGSPHPISSHEIGHRSFQKEFSRDIEGCKSSDGLTLESGDVDSENISAHIQRWVQNAAFLTECPNVTLSFKRSEHVPLILHRIWECDDIPEQYGLALGSWIQHFAGGYVALWTSEIRKRFVSKKYGRSGVDLYERLVPGAYRADLFRYVVMYHLGGIYSDMDSTLHLKLPNMGFLFRGVTAAADLDASRLLNGAILMSPPKSCLFLCALGEVFDHSEHREEFDSDLDISGPGVLGECLRHIVGKDSITFENKYLNELTALGFRIFKSEMRADSSAHIVRLDNGSTIISLEPGGKGYNRQVKASCDPGEHYSVIHARKGVYRNFS